MRDYYQDGFDDGYGRYRIDDGDYPQSDSDWYSYRDGLEEGRRRRRIADEISKELERYK
ncbi:MAG: hypothetical protein BWY04_01438 [candidate division CPR1 bacterium ADurb.Bin160]|uniref:Uncharacterized protein n=1 Tax=candidate division CPR1 bacterium ADurb.Bin160 TaxID=1852826 RepID=A0A1V5ZIZ4_9BACT|nr:MAG: hypothetical protein BWY04_01438 [candidate division CPR1 bacterium ADurb.Bin160]